MRRLRSEWGSSPLGRLVFGVFLLVGSTIACGGGSSSEQPPASDTGSVTSEVGADTGADETSPSDTGADETSADTGSVAEDAADVAPALPTMTIVGGSVTEGATGTVDLTFTVSLSAAAPAPVTVQWATADGTATTDPTAVGGADYVAAKGTLAFDTGDLSKTITVTINGDTVSEADETFAVNLSSPTGATLGAASAKGTITNDDTAPVVSIDSVAVIEGNTGTTSATFTVSLSEPSGQTVSVHYKTTDGTGTGAATSGSDYAAIADTTLTFAAGETSKTVAVTVNADTAVEPNETFTVDLSTPTNATLGTTSGVGTIQNDDGAVLPSLSVADVSVVEGNSGTKTMTFTVSLSAASTSTVTVDWKTADGSANGTDATKVGGLDYVAAASTLTFAPGETSKTFSVTVNGDVVDEDNETFAVQLSNATSAIFAKSSAKGTITNDDTAPTVSISPVTVNEGASGTTPAVFLVKLSAPSGKTVAVKYATADGTALAGAAPGGVVGGLDYLATAGSVSFAPGITTQSVSVLVNGDTRDEDDETFTVTLSSPISATLGTSSANGTITDDDATPSLRINDVSVTEGSAGTAAMVFNVVLVNGAGLATASGRPVTFGYAVTDGTATLANSDYVAVSPVDITMAPGETLKTITVQVRGDTVPELNETLDVKLVKATNATLAKAVGVGTIINDDGTLPTVNIADAKVTEGTVVSGSKLSFAVTLSAAATTAVTVDYTTADGTAKFGGGGTSNDYALTKGTLTFPAGSTTQFIIVPVNADPYNEANETVLVNLSNVSASAQLGDTQGVGTIEDDDMLPGLAISNTSMPEGNVGTSLAKFTVTLSGISGQTVTVNYATASGQAQSSPTAVGGADFVAASGTLTFAPGETSKNIDITVNGDIAYELDETFAVELSGAVNAMILSSSGKATLTNDDSQPKASLAGVTVVEGTGSLVTYGYLTVSLSAPTIQTVTVDWSTAPNSATAVFDYYPVVKDTVTFLPGETSKTIRVGIVGDALLEGDERFEVWLSSPTNASLGTAGVYVTIKNDD